MGFSISVDWNEENFDAWENHGRNVLMKSCKHKSKEQPDHTNTEYENWCEECGIHEDSAQPMMNYAYPLELECTDEDKILEIVQKTCCTVMENTKTGEYFLVLCGGGMDLSQDIALAYIIAETWLPIALIQSVSTQEGLRQGGKNFKRIADTIIEQANMEGNRLKETAKKWKEIQKSG